jgi:hypothetical protein
LVRTVFSALFGGSAALAWLGYVTSLPRQAALGHNHRDLSTLAIGLGVFLIARLVASPRVPRPAPLPAARVHH